VGPGARSLRIPYAERAVPDEILTTPCNPEVQRSTEGRRERMLDVLMLGITVAFFAVSFAFIRWLDRV
jgi:hypothetical protein